MAEAYMPGLSKSVALYRISVEDFLFPDTSLEKQSEPGGERGARLADDDSNPSMSQLRILKKSEGS
jgi:hypothetical protein